MTEPVRRRYESPQRDKQARATRRAILDAALELFASQGFSATTIREVASRAAVSEQTVYNGFGDKVGLLYHAGIEYATLAAGEADEAFLDTLRAEPDPVERIRMVARSSRQTWEAGGIELESIVFDNERHDPRLAELAARSLAYKHENTRAVCGILFPDDIRRDGYSVDDIAAFGTTVDSAATVTTVLALGWTMERWEAWIADLLVLFLEPSTIPASS